MRTLAFSDAVDPAEMRRWILSAGFVAAIHTVVVAAVFLWYAQPDIAGTGSLPMLIDLQSAPPTPEPRKLDVPPGPVMQEAALSKAAPEKQQPFEQEKIPPASLQQNPTVFAPLERKENPKPVKEKPKRRSEEAQTMSSAPAPRTTAPSPAAQAARANYTGMLSAHLQRFKQYPSSSRSAGEQGVAMLNFTVTRSGQVSSSRLTKSSGFSTLDAETVAMIRRAQPLPSFPPEMTLGSINITVPIRFAIR